MARLKTDPNALFLGLMEKTQEPEKKKEAEKPKENKSKNDPEINLEELSAMEPEDMTLPQLKAYAKQQGVKLKSARTKPEILALLKGSSESKEDEKMVLVTANLPESMKRDLDKLVYQKKMAGEKTSLTKIIRDCIEAELIKEKIR